MPYAYLMEVVYVMSSSGISLDFTNGRLETNASNSGSVYVSFLPVSYLKHCLVSRCVKLLFDIRIIGINILAREMILNRYYKCQGKMYLMINESIHQKI